MTPPTDALEQAAEWFACLQDEGVTDAQREHWQQWLLASETHREAWARVERIDRQFQDFSSMPARRVLETAGESRRQFLKGLGAVAIAAPLGWATWRYLHTEAWWADLRTATGEIREMELPDGGRLWLNTATAVNLVYTPNHRRLVLLAGEIHIQTAPDRRPFWVETPFGTATPLGTRFTIRLSDHAARVSVNTGRVAIAPRARGEPSVVEADKAMSFDSKGILARGDASAQDTAWRHGMLVADNLPLSEFLDELSRYRPGVIRYDDRIARLKLVGAFPVNDTDRVLAALEETLPVKVSQLTPWWVKVESR